MDYTLSTLLANVRRRAGLPNTATTGSQDTDIIACLNDVLQLKLAGKIITVREGYMRQTKDHTLTSVLKYRIPTRALGNKLSALMLVDGNGNVTRKLNELSQSALQEFYALNDCAGYTFEAGSVVLKPARPATSSNTLRMMYYIRPNQLTSSLDAASGNCFTVTGVSGNILTVMSSHGVTTSTRVDVIKGNAPFEHVQIGVLPTATGATTVTVPDGTEVEIGDFLCLQDKAPVAQIPGELYPLLAHLTAMEFLSAIGDRENYDKLEAALPKLEAEALALISPRNEEGSKKIMSSFGSLGAIGVGYGRRLRGV